MAIDNNAAFIWSDHQEFDGINSLEQLKHLIGAESIEGEGVGTVSGGNNGLYIVGAASNWSITITFSFKSKLKYTLDGTTTTQNLSTTHTINAPAQNALLTELNVGILPQELYRINQSPQFFYAEVSTNNVSTGKINKSSIPVAGPTGAILDWVQVNNYGIATKSFQGPTTRTPSSTGLYTFNNPTGTGLKPANFGLNENDYRTLAVNWNEGVCTQARIENGQLIYTVDGQEISIAIAPEVAENYIGLYVFNKTSSIEGRTNNVYAAGETETPITGGTRRDIFLSLSPQLNITIFEDLQPLATYDHGAEVKEVIINKYYHNLPFSLSINNNHAWTNSVYISSIGGYSNYFKYSASTGLINITYQGYTDIIPTFSITKSSHNVNGFDEPWFNNPEGGVGNTVYSISTTINWLNSKMISPFSGSTYTYGQHLNDAGKTFFTYFNYWKHNTTNLYYYGNCWLYFSNNKTFTFPSATATVTLKSNPGFISNFVADSGSDNQIFMPGNPSLNNLTPPYIINSVNQLRSTYTVPTSFDTGYIIVAALKQPS